MTVINNVGRNSFQTMTFVIMGLQFFSHNDQITQLLIFDGEIMFAGACVH